MNDESPLTNDLLHKELTSILANERTYAAWIRTALATFVTGLAVIKIFNDLLTGFSALLIALILFFCSLAFFLLAAWRYQHVGQRLITERMVGASPTLLTLLSLLLAVAMFIAAVGILT